MSQITTHVLDTSIGKPAQGVSIVLKQFKNSEWNVLGEGKTNSDGRLPNLLNADVKLQAGVYYLVFDTASYFKAQDKKAFYPEVTIAFEVTDTSHYHVPLLLNPYGYSTYRGS
ncbi:MAG: hydroxyisourate hydrolase [Bacteroidia bacterium]